MSEPLSHWQASLGSTLWSDTLPAVAEVAVIGGGLHGVSAAYWLARMGARPVLIERGALAAGYGSAQVQAPYVPIASFLR